MGNPFTLTFGKKPTEYITHKRMSPSSIGGGQKETFSGEVQSPSELYAPRGCAVILRGMCQQADQNHAPSLHERRLELEEKILKNKEKI